MYNLPINKQPKEKVSEISYLTGGKFSWTKRNETKRNGYNSLLAKNTFKTFLIATLSLILLFSISCSNEDKTGENNTGTGKDNIVNSGDNTNKNSSEETAIYSSYVGDWYDSKDNTKVMTVNSDGSITIDGTGKITNITKKSDTNFVMRYSKTQSGVTVTIIYDIKFSNSNSGTIDVTTIASGTTTPSGTINIVKK